MFKYPENEKVMINISDCIGPAFYDMWQACKEHKYSYYNLVGGRGSVKSSFISIAIVYLMMKNPDVQAVVYRKVADTIQSSTYEQICWAIDKLGVTEYWDCKKSPFRCIYRPTGQEILFKGLDRAKKSKSIKVRFGYIGILWFEELDEYKNSAEIRSVQQSVIRGGDKFWIFKSMNPPRSKNNWANQYIDNEALREDTYTSHTTYLQVPQKWLGQMFLEDAQWLKQLNEKTYRHEYLGEPVGIGTEVFDNLDIRPITEEEKQSFDHIYNGIDWGWYPDPFRFVKMNYDANRKHLWIYEEFSANKMSNKDTAQALIDNKLIVPYSELVTCDSAEKKSTADYKMFGINARNAEKGPNSVMEGTKWLQSLATITIDPLTCKKTAWEFKNAEYEVNKDGEVLSSIPDRDNHSIDATRYAMERVWTRRGN